MLTVYFLCAHSQFDIYLVKNIQNLPVSPTSFIRATVKDDHFTAWLGAFVMFSNQFCTVKLCLAYCP